MSGELPNKETYPQPKHGWTCFHCGETFKKYGTARDHFGERPECYSSLRAKLAESVADAVALREALEFYGNEENWIIAGDVGAIMRDCDGWEKAREALSRPPSEGAAAVRKLVEALEWCLPQGKDACAAYVNSLTVKETKNDEKMKWHDEWLRDYEKAQQTLAAAKKAGL